MVRLRAAATAMVVVVNFVVDVLYAAIPPASGRRYMSRPTDTRASVRGD